MSFSAAPASTLLPFREALEQVRLRFAALALRAAEHVALHEAQDRVLAAPVRADRDQPPFPRSTRDGFAVRAADLPAGAGSHGSTTLRVAGAIRAGEAWKGVPLQRGEAIEIMTGAPVPAGATAVLMVEHAERQDDALQVRRTLREGENIVPQGSEAAQGEVVLAPGVRLQPAEIALAASVGAARLPVFARPRVAILSTGDELVEVDRAPGPQQIRNSNAHALAALVRQHGGEPRLLPIAGDTAASLQAALEAAGDAPLLLLSGGVSAGKYDLVEPVLAELGTEFHFTGVAMQPGKPAVFGSRAVGHLTQWIFGLPGNPVSTQVTGMLFAMPMLRALGGETDPAPLFVSAMLSEAIAVRPGLTRFLPARLTGLQDRVTVAPTGWQGSGDLHANARSNGYVVVPEDRERLELGETVQVLLR